MRQVQKIDLPVLEDVVVPGKDIPKADELPPVLSEIQAKALQQQIEKIIQARFEVVLRKATHEAVKDIKTHLDKILPAIIKAINDPIN